MRERLVASAEVVQRLAERELEMEAIVVLEVVATERLLHGGNVGLVELDRLEVGEAPPGLAQRRIERDRLAIGGYASSAARRS